MPSGLDILTHSRRECFNECRRKHYYKYELGYRREKVSAALHFGSAFHLGLDLRAQGLSMNDVVLRLHDTYAVMPEWADGREWWTEYEQVSRLLMGYDWYWGNDGWEVEATELTFNLPIRNPATDRATSTYRHAGKVDKIIRLPDQTLAVVDHKTTGESIKPDSDFWKKAQLSQQMTLYYWAARELGHYAMCILYDVIHKPGMQPYAATSEEKRKYTKAGTLYANQREDDEPISAYGERLTDDIVKRPEYYFARREIPRTQGDVDEFLKELWDQQKTMREAERYGRHYRRTAACTTPWRCEFLDICHNGMHIDENGPPEGFVQLDFIHPELEESNASSTTEDVAENATAETCCAADCNGKTCACGDQSPGVCCADPETDCAATDRERR